MKKQIDRRKFLKCLAGASVALPVVGVLAKENKPKMQFLIPKKGMMAKIYMDGDPPTIDLNPFWKLYGIDPNE